MSAFHNNGTFYLTKQCPFFKCRPIGQESFFWRTLVFGLSMLVEWADFLIVTTWYIFLLGPWWFQVLSLTDIFEVRVDGHLESIWMIFELGTSPLLNTSIYTPCLPLSCPCSHVIYRLPLNLPSLHPLYTHTHTHCLPLYHKHTACHLVKLPLHTIHLSLCVCVCVCVYAHVYT